MARRIITVACLVSALLAIAPAFTRAQGSEEALFTSWARGHAFPLTTIQNFPDDDYQDLQFFKDVLKGRRIVQLGESGHGVAEFNLAKVRLIKFLHEQMGYDVIAFESAIYECFAANTHTGTAKQMLFASIFSVWAAEETEPLFAYIKETQKTSRPLILAGFDTQMSSYTGVVNRPAFFRNLLRVVDADYADQVFAFDTDTITRIRTGGTTYARTDGERAIEFYENLERVFRENRAKIAAAFPGDLSPKIGERAAWSMSRFVRQLKASAERPNDQTLEGGLAIRDLGMADNLTYLARELYADKKIITWAHNYHIRHDNTHSTSVTPTMGGWVAERFRDELYTIGLYMNRGRAAWNDRTIYAISPMYSGGVEWVLNSAGPLVFLDMLQAPPEAGNAWMRRMTPSREWGTNVMNMVPRDQYDGLLLIDLVSPPKYLTF